MSAPPMNQRRPKEVSVARQGPPSRHDNPFATCWTRPGAIKFQFQQGQSIEYLLARLAVQNWFGAVVGPHGSGKSTLLETLKPAFSAAGRNVRSLTLRDQTRRLPPSTYKHLTPVDVLVVDGYEQLRWLERGRLLRRCRRSRAGLIVTAHRPTQLPTLLELAPSPELVVSLVTQLCAQVSTSVTPCEVAASYARHGSNVREILFELYDCHERRERRVSNSA